MLHILLHVFRKKKRRHEIRSVFLQRGDRRVVHQVAMLDRIDTGLRRPAHAFSAVRVRSHAPAKPVCVRHNRLHFFDRVLRSVRVIALR